MNREEGCLFGYYTDELLLIDSTCQMIREADHSVGYYTDKRILIDLSYLSIQESMTCISTKNVLSPAAMLSLAPTRV